MTSYYLIDKPLALQHAFYPDKTRSTCPDYASDLLIRVQDDTYVSCRLFASNPEYPTVLFFHGNGEVASDYDSIAPYFFKLCSVNLLVAEYRGYGASDGFPTFAGLIADAHRIFRNVSEEISKMSFRKEIWVMGRSMGSVPALELAASYPLEIPGMIIESGFPCATRIVRRHRIPIPESELKIVEDECLQKLRRITIPSLIIHGERDSLVDIKEAYTIERELSSAEKRIFIIPGADHNSVMVMDIDGYFKAIGDFIHTSR